MNNFDRTSELVRLALSQSKPVMHEKKDILRINSDESREVCAIYERFTQKYYLPDIESEVLTSVIRIGDIAFFNHLLKELKSPYGFKRIFDESENIKRSIFLHYFYSDIDRNDLRNFGVVTSQAINNQDLNKRTVLDLGSSDGAQSLLSLKKGAEKVYMVEKRNDASRLTINTKNHCVQNNIPETKYDITFMNINNFEGRHLFNFAHKKDRMPKLAFEIPLNQIDFAIANIGPTYDETHLNAIRLSQYMPNLETFVLGGYINNNTHPLNPEMAIVELKKYGFEISDRYILSGEKELALVAKRKL